MSDLPIKATFKSGAGYDAPWLTIDAADPNDLSYKLTALLEGDVLSRVIDVATAFKAVNNVAPLTQPEPQAPVQQQAPAAPQGWGQQPQQQQAPAPVQGARLHPEGKVCPMCNNTLQYKDIYSQKKSKSFQFWECPNRRSQTDGHHSEFAN